MLSIESPTVTRLITQLEQDGWVTRRAAVSDGRRKTVHLTPKASTIIVRIEAAVAQLGAETVGRLTEAQATAGLAAIQAFQGFLDSL